MPYRIVRKFFVFEDTSFQLRSHHPLTAAMSAMRRPLLTTASRASAIISAPARRTFINAQRPSKLRISTSSLRQSFPRPQLQQSFRRSYADAVSQPIKRRGRGFLRWTWRLTYLSVIGGTAYLFYNIYSLRTPNDQEAPDPSKKTLVILGESAVQTLFAIIDKIQALVGARFLSSRSSTQKTTMSSSFHLVTSSSSRRFFRHVRQAQSSTDPSWSPYGVYYDIKMQP